MPCHDHGSTAFAMWGIHGVRGPKYSISYCLTPTHSLHINALYAERLVWANFVEKEYIRWSFQLCEVSRDKFAKIKIVNKRKFLIKLDSWVHYNNYFIIINNNDNSAHHSQVPFTPFEVGRNFQQLCQIKSFQFTSKVWNVSQFLIPLTGPGYSI